MAEPTKVHAAESAHWYDRDGNPVYEVNGKPTTLREARKLNLISGVSAIMRCAYSFQLEKWKIGQAILAALTLPRQPDETEEAWIDRIVTDSGDVARKAADRGTQIHEAIECFYSRREFAPEMAPFVLNVREVLDRTFGPQPWVAEKAVACRYGYGTKADLCCDRWLVDFKGTEKPADKLATYESHHMQLAATRRALQDHAMRRSEPVLFMHTRCAIVYVHRETAEVTVCEVPEPKLARGLKMFDALLTYWKEEKSYDPSW